MADVFISYASSDPAGPRAIEAALKGAGHSVWWDDQLVPGDKFSESILRELSNARVAVVIWSAASVRSDWVYSEARRAAEQNKLVQLRSRDVAIDDLPPPFDAFHCPYVDDLGALLRAVDQPNVQARLVDKATFTPTTNVHLPGSRTTLIGRDGELAELSTHFADGDRFVTLTGPGGSGKTRLAIESARLSAQAFSDGVYFVPLASTTTVDAAWAAIAEVLELPSEADAEQSVRAWVRGRRVLLLLDNLEQLPDADLLVDGLLDSGELAMVLATSRRSLHVRGEVEHGVPPLLLPTAATYEAIRASGAVQMFVDYARRVRDDFELTPDNAADVAALCAHIDGLPLAIELVASRIKLFGPAALLRRIDQALDIAVAGGRRDQRHTTIRDAIAWSYELLDEPQQHVFNCLGVFEGGADLAAIGAVVPEQPLVRRLIDDVLMSLADVSLVVIFESIDGEPRFSLLQTIKEFANDRLVELGQLEARQRDHAQYFYDLAREIFSTESSTDHAHHRATFVAELDNLGAVVSRAPVGVRHSEFYGDRPVPPAHAVMLLAWLAGFFSRGTDAIRWARLGLESDQIDPLGQFCLSRLLRFLDPQPFDSVSAVDDARQALATARTFPQGPTLPEWVDPTTAQTFALRDLTRLLADRGDLSEARQLRDQLLVAASGSSTMDQAMAYETAYMVSFIEGDFEGAYKHLAKEGDLLVTAGDNHELVLWNSNMADLELRLGRRDEAAQRLAAGAEDAIRLGDLRILTVWAAILAMTIGEANPRLCARAYGAIQALTESEGVVASNMQGEEADQLLLAPIRAKLSTDDWHSEFRTGQSMALNDVVSAMRVAAEELIGSSAQSK